MAPGHGRMPGVARLGEDAEIGDIERPDHCRPPAMRPGRIQSLQAGMDSQKSSEERDADGCRRREKG